MSLRFYALVSSVCFSLAIAACGARDSGAVPPGSVSPPAPGVSVGIHIVIPAPRHHSRHERFVAASTQGLELQAYKANSVHDSKTLLATLLVNLSANSKDCKPGSGGSRSCNVKMDLPPPAVDLEIKTWDAPPSVTAPAGKQLAAGSFLDQKIARGSANRLNFTIGGIPASLAVVLPSPTPVAGVETIFLHGTALSNTTIGLNASDADGNLIVADNYVDSNGHDQSVTLSVTPSATTCGSADLLGPSGTPGASIQIAAPLSSGAVFQFGQTATAQLFSASSPCSFTFAAAMAGIPSVPVAHAAATLLGPSLTTYAVTGKHGASSPDGIVSGPDNNIWFADTGGKAIGTIVVASPGPVTSEYEATSLATPVAPYGITVGPDNNLWFTEAGQVAQLSTLTPTVVHEYTVTGSPQIGEQISRGPADVLLWFTSASADQIYSLNDGGSNLKPYTPATPLPAGPTGIVDDASATPKILWIANATNNTIQAIEPDGTPTKTFFMTTTAASPQFVTLDSNGSVWFTSAAQGSINSMTPLGSVVSFPIGTGARPWGLSVGPDGAIWFADCGRKAIGRIPLDATSASQITEYSLGTSAIPKWVTAGSDNAVWFSDASGSIGRLTY